MMIVRIDGFFIEYYRCCSPNPTISQIAIWDIPNRSSDFGYPKSTFRFGTYVGPKSNFVPNRNLVYLKSRFGALSQIAIWALSQIMTWCITPNCDLVHYSKSQFGALSQIVIWCTIPNRDLVHCPKLRFGAHSQIVIWYTIPNHDLVYFQIAIWDISNYNLKYCNLEQKYNLNDYLIFFLIYNIYN